MVSLLSMIENFPQLPIMAVLPELQNTLKNHNTVILAAEPGSGKTTIVPLALLAHSSLQNRKIIMLEPRRLAARMAAKRMSELASDVLGGVVGYRIRFDNRVSNKTKIEVVTEGVFLRMIQNDPELSGVSLVIFDEFHERSLQSDLALAFCLDTLKLREDLKILIMSATIDTNKISSFLNNAPVITGKGRCFPVKIEYLSFKSNDYIVPQTVRTIYRAVESYSGDILVFLPGSGEILAVKKQIKGNFIVFPLYGDLPQTKQDMIFKQYKQRRVILATPIAETSLTIEGISVVIDSGLMKKPFFSPATSLSSLRTIPISKASAQQRSGRAGRLGPGYCYRLWTENEHFSKPEFLPPEILHADLSPLLLELLQWGVKNPEELDWLDPPRQGQIIQARQLLKKLGAIDSKSTLTKIGKQIATLPLHPRLALMLLHSQKNKQTKFASQIAALLQNRDLFCGTHIHKSTDIEERIEILRLFEQKKTEQILAKKVDLNLCKRIMRESKQYQKLLKITDNQLNNSGESGNLLALAYPERIAKKKPESSTHILASGRAVLLPPGDHLQKSPFIVAANVDGGKKQGHIFLAAALSFEDILANHKHLLTLEQRTEWTGEKVQTISVLSLGKLEIQKTLLPSTNPDEVSRCFLWGIKQVGPNCLKWSSKSRELCSRIETARALSPEQWPDVSETGLFKDISWLAPYLNTISSIKELKRLDLHSILLAMLSWQQQQMLEILLPTHYQAPSGSKIKLDYRNGVAPVLSIRLQEMFGVTETPLLFGGKLTIIIHLLSPARRPVQVTSDLASFWKNTYPQVKKEMAGRYPKHYWPDNPLTAEATARCKPR